MTSDEDLVASAEARARGNDLYKKGKFAEAEKAYKQAASHNRNDPLPLSNLSALYYEKGQYSVAVDHILRALKLSDNAEKNQAMYLRMARCYVHLLDLESAKGISNQISNETFRESLLSTISEMESSRKLQQDTTRYRGMMADRLPRFKPYLMAASEYFPRGHDLAESLFDKELEETIGPGDDISLLFCGSGDARNVFATIFAALFNLGKPQRKRFNKLHITILDHKPAALAKTLLMLDMMHRYAVLKVQKIPNCEDALTVMAYVYSCQLIPPFAHEKLLEHIDMLIQELEAEAFMVPCLHVAKQSIPGVLRVLKQWQQGLGEKYSTSRIHAKVTSFSAVIPTLTRGDGVEGHKFDQKCFRKLGVQFASNKFYQRREPGILDLISRFKENGSTEELANYITGKWQPNLTMFDPDFKSARTWSGDRLAQLEFSPMEIASAFYSIFGPLPGKGRSIDQFGQQFDAISLSLLQGSRNVVIEGIVAEMTDMMDRLRFDTLEHRKEPPIDPEEDHDPRTFPKVYDRIHLSNIPDYIGVHLTTFQYARPLLREDRKSNLQFNNLLNPPMFSSHAVFQSEYLHMYDDNRIAQHFHLQRRNYTIDPEASGAADMAAMMGVDKVTSFMMEDYMVWDTSPSRPLGFGKLLPKGALEKWLYSLLLKICLPFRRPLISSRPVHAPLNLTQFFRLVEHLHRVGYPAHWLSTILTSACSGAITTTARPPAALVMTPELVDKVYPNETLNIQAWRPELSTLLSIWRRALPFGFTSTPMEAPLSTISEYIVKFPFFTSENDNLPHFMVLFWNCEKEGTAEGLLKLREYLLDKFVEGVGEINNIYCLTTFDYKVDGHTATFWLRDDFAAEMKAGEWKVCIARTDSWIPVSMGIDVSDGLIRQRPWLSESETP